MIRIVLALAVGFLAINGVADLFCRFGGALCQW